MKKKCLVCNTIFVKNSQYSKRQWDNAKYCSGKCFGVIQSKRMTGAKRPHTKEWNKKISEAHLAKGLSWFKPCLYCKKKFKVYNFNPNARFCSIKCRSKVVPMPPHPDRTGSIPWNKGLNRQTDERILRMSLDRSGQKNWQWAGGVSRAHRYAYSTAEYRIWRKAVFERDDYICQICFIRGGQLEADHIKCFAHHPDLRVEISNGRTLCKNCHKKTPNFGMHKKEQCLEFAHS